MKIIIGVLLVMGGLAVGAYVSVYLCFVGGIVDIINEVRAVEVSAGGVAWGVVKIVFAGAAGWLSAAIFLLPGLACFSD